MQEKALRAIIEEAHMPLSPEQEVLCDRLEKGKSPSAAALIRQQGSVRLTSSGIDSVTPMRSFAVSSPAEMIEEEMEQLRAMLDERQQLQTSG